MKSKAKIQLCHYRRILFSYQRNLTKKDLITQVKVGQ